MRIVKLLAALIALLAAAVFAAWVATAPAGPALLSASADRLRAGPHPVASAERTLIDASRATPAHGDFAGAQSRTLETTLWYPESADGAHPLLVYSHGFMSMRSEAKRVARHLASHGFVVIAADYPATHFRAPGGPNIADAVSQPGDVSFLIDTVTAWSEAERPFRGSIDARQIGVAGLSLGGLTSTLVDISPDAARPAHLGRGLSRRAERDVRAEFFCARGRPIPDDRGRRRCDRRLRRERRPAPEQARPRRCAAHDRGRHAHGLLADERRGHAPAREPRPPRLRGAHARARREAGREPLPRTRRRGAGRPHAAGHAAAVRAWRAEGSARGLGGS